MDISFHGAARTVTGSKHLITLNNKDSFLLDCGMFQGLGDDTDALNSTFGFDVNSIKFLLLSHAHIDHSGLIPKLVKEGFSGKIYCTAATAELTEILLHDSAEIQTYETDHINKKRAAHNLEPYEALYTHEDVMHAMQLFTVIDYNRPFKPARGISVVYTNNGHLVGSAAIHITIKEKESETTILYSGDVGKYKSVLLQPPADTPPADYIILESTYGDRHHNLSFSNVDVLNDWIQKTCIEKQGKLIIPAFSVGRTQEVLYSLNQLELEKRLPELNYFVDSPLSHKATETLKKYPELYNDTLQKILQIDDDPFLFKGLKYIDHAEDSRRLKETDRPCVIISASGTADAGRVRHHIAECIDDYKNSVLLVGYCGSNSLGGMLLDGAKEVELFNETIPVAAEVGVIKGMSAHGDSDDLIQFVSSQNGDKVKGIFLVHGEYKTQVAFASRLQTKGFNNIVIPQLHEVVHL